MRYEESLENKKRRLHCVQTASDFQRDRFFD